MNAVAILAGFLTVIEVLVLVKWLGLATMPTTGLAAYLVLLVGIGVEELLRFRGIRKRFPSGTELTLVAAGVTVEVFTWILAFGRAHVSVVDTFVTLFVGLDIEHAIIAAATSRTPAGTLADFVASLGRVADFSAVEAAGGTIWLAAPSVGTLTVMAIMSVLEHVQGLRQAFGLR
jgi:hypothetical protein